MKYAVGLYGWLGPKGRIVTVDKRTLFDSASEALAASRDHDGTSVVGVHEPETDAAPVGEREEP